MVHVEGGAGWHEATCHPRPGGACEARALCREGRRGSPVAPCPATRRKGHPGLEGGAGWHEATCHPRLGGACEARALCREGRRGSPVAPCPATRRKGCDRTGPHGPGGAATTQKKEGGSNESPSRKTAATYSPNWCVSTIGVDGLNFSVRNGKRWVPGAIATAI